jgi:hypothetical protein
MIVSALGEPFSLSYWPLIHLHHFILNLMIRENSQISRCPTSR